MPNSVKLTMLATYQHLIRPSGNSPAKLASSLIRNWFSPQGEGKGST